MSRVQFVSSISAELEKQLSALRQQKGLNVIPSDREGAPLATLPDNLYGFTFSPLNESTPLYAKRLFQSFEVHKLGAGVVHLLGFLTEQEAALFFAGKDPLECNLFPEPFEASTRLVEVPLERLAKAKPLTRTGGNFMPVTLDPA